MEIISPLPKADTLEETTRKQEAWLADPANHLLTLTRSQKRLCL